MRYSLISLIIVGTFFTTNSFAMGNEDLEKKLNTIGSSLKTQVDSPKNLVDGTKSTKIELTQVENKINNIKKSQDEDEENADISMITETLPKLELAVESLLVEELEVEGLELESLTKCKQDMLESGTEMLAHLNFRRRVLTEMNKKLPEIEEKTLDARRAYLEAQQKYLKTAITLIVTTLTNRLNTDPGFREKLNTDPDFREKLSAIYLG